MSLLYLIEGPVSGYLADHLWQNSCSGTIHVPMRWDSLVNIINMGEEGREVWGFQTAYVICQPA